MRWFSWSIFKPQLQSAIVIGHVYEGWSAWEENVLYHVLVPLQPLPGHAFYFKQSTRGDADQGLLPPCA